MQYAEEGHSSACRRRDLLSLTAGAALWLQSCRQAQALSADFTEPQPTKGLGNSAPGGSSAKARVQSLLDLTNFHTNSVFVLLTLAQIARVSQLERLSILLVYTLQ